MDTLLTGAMVYRNMQTNVNKLYFKSIDLWRRCSAFIIVLFIASFVSGQRERPDGRKPEDPNTWIWSIPDKMDHVIHDSVYSESMDRAVGFNVYLPPSYSELPSRRYSVVYFLHGAGGDEKTSAYMMEIILPEVQSGEAEEAIFVFVNGGHWSGYRDSESTYVKSETHLIEELIPAIDERYRTQASRSGRAIFGYSMGGGGSVRLALKYPELFCAAGSFSGALDWSRDSAGKSISSRVAYPEDNAYYWATQNRDKLVGQLALFLTVGGSEWLYEDHPPFIEHLRGLGVHVNYSVQGDLDHNLGTSKKLFGSQMIRFLSAHYSRPMATAAGGETETVEMRPVVRGDWRRIASNPDLGEWTSERQEPVDFGIWQARDGTWQLWSCIRKTNYPGRTRVFHRWEGKRLTDTNWEPKGITFKGDGTIGETIGGMQAPYVIKVEDKYRMYYGDYRHICLAISDDGKSFEKQLPAFGMSGLFGEGPTAMARDPMLLKIGSLWYCYYSAQPQGEHGVWLRTSTDLVNFENPRRVMTGGQSGVEWWNFECPHVVYHKGYYYLFHTQNYGVGKQQTSVYRNFVCHLPIAAPEIVYDGDQMYLAALSPGLDGVRIVELDWVED